MPLCIIFESKKPIGFRIIPVFAYFAVYFVHFTASCWFLKTATLLNQFRIWNCPCIQIFMPWWTSEALSPILSLIPWTILAGEKKTKGPEGRSVMPHISVMLGSVLFGGFNQRNKEKKFGTFIAHPLLLGFRSCWVRCSGVLLYLVTVIVPYGAAAPLLLI